MYADGSYLKAHSDWHSFRAAWKASQVVQGVRQVGIRPASLCDIGCGTGLALAETVRQLGGIERAVGFEPSPDAPFHDNARDLVERRSEDATRCQEHFDLALMLDVFEHIEDCYGFVRACGPLASHHIFHIPLDAHCFNILHNGFASPRKEHGHLHYFTRISALALLEAAGYRVLHWHYTEPLWEKPRSQALSRRPVNLARRVLKVFSKEWTSRLLGGLALLVVARYEGR